MELYFNDLMDVYTDSQKEEINKRWNHRYNEIEKGFEQLLNSFQNRRLSAKEETEKWFEFITLTDPSHLNVDVLFQIAADSAIAIIYNNFQWLPTFNPGRDLHRCQYFLRLHFDINTVPGDNGIDPDHINGFIIAESIIQFLDNLSSPSITGRKSKEIYSSLLMKVLLLKKLGFFSLPKVNQLQSSTELGALLNVLLGGHEDSLRRMAGNAKEPKSNLGEAYDIYRGDIQNLLEKRLSEKLPSFSLD